MNKFLNFLLVIVIFAITPNIFAQDANTRSLRLPNSSDFKPTTIKPNFAEGNIKWEETFNTLIQPSNWLVIDNDGSGSAYTFEQLITFTGGNVIPQAGQSFWFSNYTNANSSGLIDEWLISPQIPTIASGDSLIFYAGSIGGTYPDSLKVLISTTDQNPSSFTEIAYFLVSGPIGAWNRYAFDLSAFAGSQIYAAVNYYIVDGGPLGNNSDNVWVDHFIVTSGQSNTARVQVIHNSADVLAGSVDIYVNDALAIPDFEFRSATPFIDLPAGVTLNIGVAPGNSTSVNDTLKNFPVVLASGEKYVVFANGVLTSGYAPNPDSRSTDFTLFVKPMAQEVGTGSGVDLFVLHGSTDAPTVDVKVRELSSATIVDDAAYGDITPYLTAPAQSITLDLYLGNGVNYVASFTAPLTGLGGGSAAVFASGFLDPTSNQNGAAFGLFAALANGTVVQLPAATAPSARVQVIHNSADVLAGSVDVYVNDALAIPDFAFRTATPFIDLPAGVTLNIGVAPGNSTSVNDTLANFPVILSADEKYVVIANGLLTGGYLPNPDGRNTGFTLLVKTMARETAVGSDVDLFVLHGSTDAPTVDVKAREAGNLVLVNDAAYGDLTPYFSVPAGNYTLDLYLADGTTLVASFIAPLAGLSGGAAAVFASGFLNPSGNQNGAAFGLFAALPNGTVISLNQGVVPVELSAFTANVKGSDVSLSWSTATETNNNGFEIQRKSGESFVSIGFVRGKGTTTEIQNYSFTDSKLPVGSYSYRLKQVDFDGSFEYSNILNVDLTAPSVFALEQNYPNPFNPSTIISYSIPQNSFVTIKVYDILGNEVSTLVNQTQSAGKYDLRFDASSLSNGVYLYSIKTDNFSSTKKMILMK
ncbi:MAG: DUF4397 domain-containing protein [Ignavibacteriales bacterium]|nr:DUF4397 domain-containing protein [Ignavibacteriales bacterium]MBK7632602.1 DUF4397 domain-containing protein [Ignavibacteriales bacterium]